MYYYFLAVTNEDETLEELAQMSSRGVSRMTNASSKSMLSRAPTSMGGKISRDQSSGIPGRTFMHDDCIIIRALQPLNFSIKTWYFQ